LSNPNSNVDTMHYEIKSSCDLRVGMLYEIDELYQAGGNILCTSKCPCKADKSLWDDSIQAEIITDMFGSNQLTDCPTTQLTNYQRDRYVPIMQALEKTFKCAGMCSDPKLFLFSDVAQ